jgi:hypothetical protein
MEWVSKCVLSANNFMICLYLYTNVVVAWSVNLLGGYPSLSLSLSLCIRPVVVAAALLELRIGNCRSMHVTCSPGCCRRCGISTGKDPNLIDWTAPPYQDTKIRFFFRNASSVLFIGCDLVCFYPINVPYILRALKWYIVPVWLSWLCVGLSAKQLNID